MKAKDFRHQKFNLPHKSFSSASHRPSPSLNKMKFSLVTLATVSSAAAFSPSSFSGKSLGVSVESSSTALSMKYKVAVVGGGPAGACAAEIFAQEKGIDTVMFERKLDNAKPCGGAIPLCMVGEFDLPESVVDRKVRSFVGNKILSSLCRRHGSCYQVCTEIFV